MTERTLSSEQGEQYQRNTDELSYSLQNPRTYQERPHGVVDFVLSEVETYEELNHPTWQERDEAFRKVLIQALQYRDSYGATIGHGDSLIVSALDDVDGVVLKQLHFDNAERHIGKGLSVEQYWEAIQQEHSIVERYFGSRFVPDTEFLTVERKVSWGEGYEPEVVTDYLMVQDRIYGVPVNPLYPYSSKIESTPELKSELVAFIRSYEDMMRKEGLVIEDQIMIDPSTSRIMISDTNSLRPFVNIANSHWGSFLQRIGVEPAQITDSNDIINILANAVPAFEHLRGRSYSEVEKVFADFDAPEIGQAERWILDNYGEGAWQSCRSLISAINYFAPEGEHNQYITALMSKFEITDADLSDSQ